MQHTADVPARIGLDQGDIESDQLVEITRGLQPTDKLIVGGRASIADGVRIRVAGEDRSLSRSDANRSPGPRTAQADEPNG